MSKVDITDRVIAIRSESKQKEAELLASKVLPSWMQKPFDEYYADKSNASTSKDNVVKVDFSPLKLDIPKALAASSAALQTRTWYEQGRLSTQLADGSQLEITFNKSSGSDLIDMDIMVVNGTSDLLQAYIGQTELKCSLFDNGVELASLTASINNNGTFMHAEGVVLNDFEPAESSDCISLCFHHDID